MADILVVEDKPSFGNMLKASLEDAAISVRLVKNGREALRFFKKEKFEIAIIDLRLPDIDGIDLLRELKRFDTDTKFLIMTAFGTIERAVEAMKLGAYDFLTKPFDVEQLIVLINRILEEQRRYYENILLRDETSKIHGAPEIIGKGPAIKHVAQLLEKAAPTDTTVPGLLLAIELISHLLHDQALLACLASAGKVDLVEAVRPIVHLWQVPSSRLVGLGATPADVCSDRQGARAALHFVVPNQRRSVCPLDRYGRPRLPGSNRFRKARAPHGSAEHRALGQGPAILGTAGLCVLVASRTLLYLGVILCLSAAAATTTLPAIIVN